VNLILIRLFSLELQLFVITNQVNKLFVDQKMVIPFMIYIYASRHVFLGSIYLTT
jgi:hypothetical protein